MTTAQFNRRAKQIHRKLRYKSDFEEVLKTEFGMKLLQVPCTTVFINDSIIVKWGTLIAGVKPKKNTIPTYYCTLGGYNIVIQPRAKRHDLCKALALLRKMSPEWTDCALRNCGWFNGKPVIFDW